MCMRIALSLQQKNQIREEHQRRLQEGLSCDQSTPALWAKHKFKLSKPPSQATISRVLKNTNAAHTTQNIYRTRQGAFPQFKKALLNWVLLQFSQRRAINGALIIESGRRILEVMNENLDANAKITLTLSKGWLYKFQKRHRLKSFKSHGESGDADDSAIAEKLGMLRAKVGDYNAEDCYNADEFGLFYRLAPDRTIAPERLPGRKKEKVRLTFLACANSTGTDRIPLLIIGKARRPHCFKKKTGSELGFDYHCNKKAWMTSSIFLDWLQRFSSHIETPSPSKKVLLLLHNASVHGSIEVLPVLPNVEVVFLPPNTTSKLQPMDAGVIASLKQRYRSYLYRRALDQMDIDVLDIYKVDQLAAMRQVKRIWESDMKDSVFRNCWLHTGLVVGETISQSDQDDEETLGSELIELAQQLVPTAVFNRVTVSSLLNVDGENEECTSVPTVDEIAINALDTGNDEEDNEEDVEEDKSLLDDLSVDERLAYLAVTLLILEEEGATDTACITGLRRAQRGLRSKRVNSLSQSRIDSFFPVQ